MCIRDRVYALSENICSNPTNLIYVFYDNENIIHGVLWARINILDENLYVSILSVDEEYQGVNGAPIDAAYALLNMVRNDANLKKIIWSTTRPKASCVCWADEPSRRDAIAAAAIEL